MLITFRLKRIHCKIYTHDKYFKNNYGFFTKRTFTILRGYTNVSPLSITNSLFTKKTLRCSTAYYTLNNNASMILTSSLHPCNPTCFRDIRDRTTSNKKKCKLGTCASMLHNIEDTYKGKHTGNHKGNIKECFWT